MVVAGTWLVDTVFASRLSLVDGGLSWLILVWGILHVAVHVLVVVVAWILLSVLHLLLDLVHLVIIHAIWLVLVLLLVLVVLVKWWQVSHVHLLLAEHLIALFVFLDLPSELLDLDILHLKFSLEVSLEVVRSIVLQHHLILLDLLSKVVHLLLLVVDLLEQLYVFVHDLGILLFVVLLILLEHLLEVVALLLKPLSLLRVDVVQVRVTAVLAVEFLFNVLLVKTDHAGLQLFEVGDVMQALEDVILELLLVLLLFVQLLAELLDLIGETFLSKTHVIDDQSQVLVNTVEEL